MSIFYTNMHYIYLKYNDIVDMTLLLRFIYTLHIEDLLYHL